ncbi:MAG: hypothetical protein WC437_01165 [Patescibacteria group bacterium]|jgi:nucleoside 2-deoxyribosyltransferase|nr:hypothetical protein [Patescibacteria group bacterium]
MKIVICGSSSFCKEKVKIKQDLANLGHKGILNKWDEQVKRPTDYKMSDTEIKKERDLIIAYYRYIAESDGILVTNYDKNGIKNYIGANTFLEMGYAYALNKKIYILNDIPTQKYINDEVEVFEPLVLNGDLKKII